MSKSRNRKLKRRIRERMAKTGESYSTARMHILNLGSVPESTQPPPRRGLAIHALLASLHSSDASKASNPRECKEARRRRSKRLWQRLLKSLNRLYPPAAVPPMINNVREELRAGRSLHSIVLAFDSIPTQLGWRGISSQIRQAMAQLQPVIDATRDLAHSLEPEIEVLTQQAKELGPYRNSYPAEVAEFARQMEPLIEAGQEAAAQARVMAPCLEGAVAGAQRLIDTSPVISAHRRAGELLRAGR